MTVPFVGDEFCIIPLTYKLAFYATFLVFNKTSS